MGIFGRSEAQEKAQFTAAYNKWFDYMHEGECQNRGVHSLPLEVMQEINRFALNQAASDTYKIGQTIRVTDLEMQGLFTTQMRLKTMESVRRIAEERGQQS